MKISKNNFFNSYNPYLIGITGNFGTGKSLVGNILQSHGVTVFDTDDIVAKILSSKNLATKKIVNYFGDSIVNNLKSQYLNKKALAKMVFNSAKKLRFLESIIHPEVRKILKSLIQKNKNQKIIAVLIPLLFESKQECDYNETWCIVCSKDIQYKRLLKKGFTLHEIKLRLQSQMKQAEKTKKVDIIINNLGSRKQTKHQVLNRLNLLLAQLNRNPHPSSGK